MEVVGPSAQAVLWEASELALKQDKEEAYWRDRVLLDIGDAQIRTADFEGALRSIGGCRDTFMRQSRRVDLAEALARDGNRERACEILHLLDGDKDSSQAYREDRVQRRWIEYLTARRDLDSASKAIEQLQSKRYRPDALRNLAVAYANSNDAARAAEQFTRALDAAADLNREFDLAQAMWETADAQLAVGKTEAAMATVRRLVEIEFKDPSTKVAALRECAVLAAKANDKQTAYRLFGRAIAALNAVDAENKNNATNQIAVAQAGVGYIDDAQKTAWMIKHDPKDFSQDSPRESALYAIAVAQVKADDAEGAVRTALSVEYFIQYRDDALHKIVEHQIAKRDIKAATTTAEKIHNPSRKAAAMLKVATALAKSGDRRAAADLAAQIELAHRAELPAVFRKEHFDYRLPRTWGVCYDEGLGFTMASHHMSMRRTVEVAAAAMALSQALKRQPAESYAILFNEISAQGVIWALARNHAVSGDQSEALAWAKKIGSGDRAESRDDSLAVERRIYALLGVAEGMLDRSRDSLPQPGQ
jgi:tetratricopeptide (TPR) repeat protein